jgi:hypothetical protein
MATPSNLDVFPKVHLNTEAPHFCNTSFSLQIKLLNCRATKALEIFLTSNISCLYVHPYLEIEINGRFRTTVLAEAAEPTGSNAHYSFGNISIPATITAQTVMIRIGSYFNSSFDILANVDKKLDLNDGEKEVNAILIDWEQIVPNLNQENKTLKGAWVCTPLPGLPDTDTELLAQRENTTKCAFSQYTPGFWDTRAQAFIPAGCAYLNPPLREEPAAGSAWVHFLGDSNMRNLHAQACERIRSPRTHIVVPPGANQTGFSTRVCLSRGGGLALVFSAAWMSGAGSHFGESLALLGRPLAPLLCPMVPSPGCTEAWNRTANRTLALVGSHYPQQPIPRARADVRAWLAGVAARLPPRPGVLAVALVGGVCVERFHSVPRYWPQLFQRNNYRLRAVNDATLAAARVAGAAAADLFSMSLAAGCGPAVSADVVHFRPPVYAAQADALLGLLADLL